MTDSSASDDRWTVGLGYGVVGIALLVLGAYAVSNRVEDEWFYYLGVSLLGGAFYFLGVGAVARGVWKGRG